MLVLIANWFQAKDSSNVKEFVVEECFNADTLETVIVPSVHPKELGAVFDEDIGEYVIYD